MEIRRVAVVGAGAADAKPDVIERMTVALAKAAKAALRRKNADKLRRILAIANE